MSKPVVSSFFDEATNTVSYVVQDPASKAAAIVDPVLDYDPKSGRTSTKNADKIASFVTDSELNIDWILETHAHADHLTAAPYLQGLLGGKIAIGEHIRDVQKIFKDVFNIEKEFLPDGSQFDHLFAAGDAFTIGTLEGYVLHTPGHTPACLTYVIGDAAFVGDTLFMPDVGTARADFPGGDAHVLYKSTQRILELPRETRLFLCHDYGPDGRPVAWETTVGEQQDHNIHVGKACDEDKYVAMRKARDLTLEMPTLILPSIQVNIRAGHMPPPEDNGVTYLKIPVNAL